MSRPTPYEVRPLQWIIGDRELEPGRANPIRQIINDLAQKVQRTKDLAVLWIATTLEPPGDRQPMHVHLIDIARRLSVVKNELEPDKESWWLDYDSSRRQFICTLITYCNGDIGDWTASAKITAGFRIDAPSGLDQVPQTVMDGTHPLADDMARAIREIERQEAALHGFVFPTPVGFCDIVSHTPAPDHSHPQDGGARPDNS